MKRKIHKLKNKLRRRAEPQLKENVPRITNETVAAHREEVLGKARKYIYPLQHSKHRIVIISISVFIVTIVAFFTYCTLALYKFQSTSTFIYRVTQVIPFPVARTGNTLIAYENYLFELRHYKHYYETQLEVNFDNPGDRVQLEQFKRRALEQVVDHAYIKQLAAEHGITVTDQEVDNQIAIARSQNRLGESEKVFEDVLQDYWGWTVADFKRSLRQQLLAQKVAAALDTGTRQRADAALDELNRGADFGEVAKKYSEDAASKDNDGEYGFPIERTSRDIPASVAEELFKLEPGETSGIINTGPTIEIVKVLEKNNNKLRAAHIVFNFESPQRYVNDLKEAQPTRVYIRLPEAVEPEVPTDGSLPEEEQGTEAR
jgi:hypothetical protein